MRLSLADTNRWIKTSNAAPGETPKQPSQQQSSPHPHPTLRRCMNSSFKLWISNLLGGYGDEDQKDGSGAGAGDEEGGDDKSSSSKAPLPPLPSSPAFSGPSLRPINVKSSLSSSSSAADGGADTIPKIVRGVMDGYTAEEYLSIIDQLKLTIKNLGEDLASAKAECKGHQQLCEVLRAQLSKRHGITSSSKKEEVIYGAADLTDEVLESISEKEGAIKVDREDESICHYQVLGGDAANANDNGQIKPRKRLSNPILERLAVMGELERWYLQPSTISLKSELGRGSFGVTNKAVIASTNVAVKRIVIKRNDTENIHNVYREIAILAHLRHPYILGFMGAAVIEKTREDGKDETAGCNDDESDFYDFEIWLCAELINNGTVRRWLRGPSSLAEKTSPRQTLRLPPTTMQYRLRVALEVAEAMAYASSRFHNRFIHRDIKSSNVFLDDAGHAKLADFGIARLIPFPKKRQSSEETTGGRGGQGRGRAAKAAAEAAAGATANTLFSERDDYQDMTGESGTYIYMAPEVIRHEKYDPSVDVYSWGILLWELVHNETPYDSMHLTAVQVAAGVADGNLRPKIVRGCFPCLRQLMEASWHKDPRRRPSFDVIVHTLTKNMADMLHYYRNR